MRALIQRVSQASVSTSEGLLASIGPGMLILVGITHSDSDEAVERMAKKILALRIFADQNDKMNLPLGEREILCISQFTLYGDTSKGTRPSFKSAAPAALAERLYRQLSELLGAKMGQFGAHMQISSLNDGPVTLLLEVE